MSWHRTSGRQPGPFGINGSGENDYYLLARAKDRQRGSDLARLVSRKSITLNETAVLSIRLATTGRGVAFFRVGAFIGHYYYQLMEWSGADLPVAWETLQVSMRKVIRK